MVPPQPQAYRFVRMTARSHGAEAAEGFRRRSVGLPKDAMKRLADVVLATVFLAALLPLFGLIALSVWLDSGSPILYTQARLGWRARLFRMFKFRTMVVHAETGTGAVWAAVKDPRVTRLGAILRRTHLDELPQLWNVLRGEMSVVGPRPERPELVDSIRRDIPEFEERCRVRPGITGLAQILSGYASTVQATRRKFAYDLHYIQNHNLLLDLKIMVSTLPALTGDRNAR